MSTNDPQQQQMIREAMKSIAERRPGRTKLVYDKTRRTIVAVAEGAQAPRALNITADDADMFAGKDVAGPFTAYAQANVIGKHAKDIAGGKTYAELAQDDPNRSTVMTASFLQASLFTSVVAFGVSAMAAVMGVLWVMVGWALVRLGRRPAV